MSADTTEVVEIKWPDNSYHDVDCCEWTRGVDALLQQYRIDRDKIVTDLLSNPNRLIETIWKADGPLAIDNGCQCQMGHGDIRSAFSCAQCKNLRRLIDFRAGGSNKAFKLECGDQAGRNLIVIQKAVSNPFLKWEPAAVQKALSYTQQYKYALACGTPDFTHLKCLTGDAFTISTLILMGLHDHFSQENLPHIPCLYTSFICHQTGYYLFDLPSIGTLVQLQQDPGYCTLNGEQLKSSVVYSIIVQLLVVLQELTQFNFSHGNPSLNSLVFTKEPVSYRYRNLHVEGEITLQMTDLIKSSATFNQVHYYPKDLKTSLTLENIVFVPEITTKQVLSAWCQENPSDNFCQVDGQGKFSTVYRLTSSNLEIYQAIRHIGFPLYAGSFDFYCLMVVLMSNATFYRAVYSDEKLYRLWAVMWQAEDFATVEESLRQLHHYEASNLINQNNYQPLNIVKNKWLRCDILDYLWSHL